MKSERTNASKRRISVVKSMLDVENINTFYGESHILHDVSLSVSDGEIVALVGRNGAGKTTTLRSITGIQPPETGTVRFENEDITHEDIPSIAEKGIRIVLENRRPFPALTVEENLQLSKDTTYGSEWTIDRIEEFLPRLGERMDQNAGSLSGGEQQMLAMAQALVGNPKLMLLDEPLEGLAPQIVETIVEIIEKINDAGMPILLVEQDFNVCLDLMDRGYILHKGEIKLSGDVNDFLDAEDKIDRFLGVNI